MMFYLYLDTGFASRAENEEEAKEEARLWFIKALQEKHIEFMVEDEQLATHSSNHNQICYGSNLGILVRDSCRSRLYTFIER